MLTTAVAKAAAPQARAYKLADAGGMHLLVRPTGSKSWQLKYRWHGREKLLTIGAFPAVSLPEARARREAAKEQLRNGVDPSSARANDGSSDGTFEQLARAWYHHNLSAWSPAHAADAIGSLERDVLPAIGARPAGSIEPPELLQLLRAVERRGNIVTAQRIRQRLSEIFAFGIAEGLVDIDPAAKLGAAMREAPPAVPQPALTRIESCRELLEACKSARARSAIIRASELLALTAVRLDAVRGARWEEFEGLGGDTPIWRVPAARMKLKRAKKGEARFDHAVPLSRQAVAVLRRAAEIGYDARPEAGLGCAGRGEGGPPAASTSFSPFHRGLVFPGRDRDRPIGEGAIGALYDRAGFSGRHVPHGWRASFSTIMNRDLGNEWRSAIDLALAHAPKDKVEAAYNRDEQLERRRTVFDRWGELLAGAEPLPH